MKSDRVFGIIASDGKGNTITAVHSEMDHRRIIATAIAEQVNAGQELEGEPFLSPEELDYAIEQNLNMVPESILTTAVR